MRPAHFQELRDNYAIRKCRKVPFWVRYHPSMNHNLRKGIISYEGLPISSGGAHSLGKEDHNVIWSRTDSFLNTCAQRTSPPKIYYLLTIDKSIITPQVISRTALRFTLKYGFPSHPISSTTMNLLRWRIPGGKPEKVIELLKNIPPSPPHPIYGDILALGIKIDFNFISPLSGEPLPYQHPKFYLRQCVDWRSKQLLGRSTVYVRLARKSTLYTFLSFPFEETGEEFNQYSEFIRNNFPTKLSDKHWKVWHLNKERSRYYSRAIKFDERLHNES